MVLHNGPEHNTYVFIASPEYSSKLGTDIYLYIYIYEDKTVLNIKLTSLSTPLIKAGNTLRAPVTLAAGLRRADLYRPRRSGGELQAHALYTPKRIPLCLSLYLLQRAIVANICYFLRRGCFVHGEPNRSNKGNKDTDRERERDDEKIRCLLLQVYFLVEK